MKKIMVKNLLILSLAFGALVVIGNNVYAEGDHEEIDWIDDSPGGGGVSVSCYNTGTWETGDSFRSCTNCKTAYNTRPNTWDTGTCKIK